MHRYEGLFDSLANLKQQVIDTQAKIEAPVRFIIEQAIELGTLPTLLYSADNWIGVMNPEDAVDDFHIEDDEGNLKIEQIQVHLDYDEDKVIVEFWMDVKHPEVTYHSEHELGFTFPMDEYENAVRGNVGIVAFLQELHDEVMMEYRMGVEIEEQEAELQRIEEEERQRKEEEERKRKEEEERVRKEREAAEWKAYQAKQRRERKKRLRDGGYGAVDVDGYEYDSMQQWKDHREYLLEKINKYYSMGMEDKVQHLEDELEYVNDKIWNAESDDHWIEYDEGDGRMRSVKVAKKRGDGTGGSDVYYVNYNTGSYYRSEY